MAAVGTGVVVVVAAAPSAAAHAPRMLPSVAACARRPAGRATALVVGGGSKASPWSAGAAGAGALQRKVALPPSSSSSRRRPTQCRVVLAINPITAQWLISGVSVALLAAGRGRGPLLAALAAIAAPSQVVEWLRTNTGRYLALALVVLRSVDWRRTADDVDDAVKRFLNLPTAVLLALTVAPTQLLAYRYTTAAAVIALSISLFLGYEHASSVGSSRLFNPSDNAVTTIGYVGLAVLSLVALA
eukprot:jgi/Chlat1/578/Chrsp103S01139